MVSGVSADYSQVTNSNVDSPGEKAVGTNVMDTVPVSAPDEDGEKIEVSADGKES